MNVLILTEKSYVAEKLSSILSDKRVRIGGIDGHVYTRSEKSIFVSDEDLKLALKLHREEEAWLLGLERVQNAILSIKNVLFNNHICCIINACDDDDNGDYLFDYVYDNLGVDIPVKRMRIKDLCAKDHIRAEYDRCWEEFLSENVYLKIYVENGDTLVLEGNGTEDVADIYYPARWDDKAHRFGTVTIGKNHIAITQEAKVLFRRIVDEARHTGDDMSCLDIHKCHSRKANQISNDLDDVCVSYVGKPIMRLKLEDVINNNDFFIGCGEGKPNTWLLDELITI